MLFKVFVLTLLNLFMNNVKLVTLSGGLGSRLGIIINTIPKPMVEIESKPILWHILKNILTQDLMISYYLGNQRLFRKFIFIPKSILFI